MPSSFKRSAGFRRLTIASAVCLPIACGACAPSARIDKRPVVELGSILAEPPAALSAECEKPVELPDAALSAGAVERAWAEDRAGLAACHDRHAATLRFYQDRDAALAGK